MNIAFRDRKLLKIFSSHKRLVQAYGQRMAKVIETRMDTLQTAACLDLVPIEPPNRRHQLTGDRHEQFSVDLVHPMRLLFIPDHNPIPRKDDGGVDLTQVTAVAIIEVADTHR